MPHSSLSQTSHVSVKLRSIHAILEESISSSAPDEWRIEVSICGMGGLILVPVVSSSRTAPIVSRRESSRESAVLERKRVYPSIRNATHDCVLDQLLQVPIRWRDLPRDAYLLIRIIERGDNVIYETTMALFGAYGRLRTGLQRLDLEKPNSNHEKQLWPPRNPGLVGPPVKGGLGIWEEEDPVWKASLILEQLDSFEVASKEVVVRSDGTSTAAVAAPRVGSQTFGDIPSVPWLDSLTKQHCHDVLNEVSSQKSQNPVLKLSENGRTSASIIIELPKFEVPIIHEETHYPLPPESASGPVSALDVVQYRKASQQGDLSDRSIEQMAIVPFLDYESELDNPVEDKYRTLAHDLLRGLVDPALKPDREQRDRLAAIIASPSHHPTREEKDLLWRFRFSLVDNRRALTKFLVAVDWTVESEVVQAAELLEQWRKRSPIEVTDALKLLGKHVAFQTSLVREYAIDTLATAPDAELRLYLLQLVQAIKYENTESAAAGLSSPGGSPGPSVSSLATFLIERASKNIELANYLYWYIKVELDDPTYGPRYREVFRAMKDKLSKAPFDEACQPSDTNQSRNGKGTKSNKGAAFKSIVDSVSKLASSRKHPENAGESAAASEHTVKGRKTIWDILIAQDRFIARIIDIQLKSRHARGKKDAKEMHLKELLRAEGFDRYRGIHPVPLPSAPHIMVNGVNPQSAKLFKSALYPALIEFHVDSYIHHEPTKDTASQQKASTPVARLPAEHSPDPSDSKKKGLSSYKVMLKTGDDLRQDQLVMMIIQLMDGLLKRGSLDLCLRPYSIIAMSTSSGLVEFVDQSMPISQVLAGHNNSILQFFQAVSPKRGAKYDVQPETISTYVRSCAGYCVITYILGVGDRHLDNIMLQLSGHFFHIDFGFIFGRDPKPLPPAFRLTREMVDGMGGIESAEYRQFCSLACQAFNTLRKSAGLILNLLHLMEDAGIEDLSNNPAADAEGIISKVEERFKLELTDEQAERYFIGLINESLAAFAPRVMDVFHSLAVARR
jgi:phosphatidylinositol 3-kinase